MGLYLVFGTEGGDAPVDDATGWTASNTGWAHFADWAADLPPDRYPEMGYLAEHGDCFSEDGSPQAVEALEAELARALEEKPGDPTPEVLGVGKLLLRALRRRPADALAVIITDGTGQGDEEEEGDEDEEDEDPDNGLDDSDQPEVEEEDVYGSLEGVQGKSAACACGPGCGCSPCKAKALEDNEEECRKLQEQLLAFDAPIDFINAALRTGKALGGIKAALSSMAEGSGGALVGPAGQEHKDHLDGQVEEQLRQKLVELTARREKLRVELCERCGICETGEGDRG
jgi:hypothetical protein